MRKAIILFIFIVIFIIGCSQTKITNPEVRTNSEDISIEAILKLNENERVSHKDYMLEIVIDKAYGQNMVYPYIKGLYTMTYDSYEKDIYTPSSIGSSFTEEETVVGELRKQGVIGENETFPYQSFIGFHFPEEEGKYSTMV